MRFRWWIQPTRQLHVLTSIFDWFTGLAVCFVIGLGRSPSLGAVRTRWQITCTDLIFNWLYQFTGRLTRKTASFSSPMRAHANRNSPISREKKPKNRLLKCRDIGLVWELNAPSDELLVWVLYDSNENRCKWKFHSTIIRRSAPAITADWKCAARDEVVFTYCAPRPLLFARATH